MNKYVIDIEVSPAIVGVTGKSAYQTWLDLGNVGTEDQFIASLSQNLEPLKLNVTQSGQTIWNIGLTQPRNSLYVNGVLYMVNIDYTITLPYLTWNNKFQISVTDELILK